MCHNIRKSLQRRNGAYEYEMIETILLLLLLLSGTAYMGRRGNVPNRSGIPPDSGSRGIYLSNVVDDSHWNDYIETICMKAL